MTKRVPKIYYIQEKQGQKALLIFDAGHDNGDIHIYEHRETISTALIEQQLKKDNLDTDGVRYWVEKTFRPVPETWKLVPEG